MKKLFAIILALIMCISVIAACGSATTSVSASTEAMFVTVERNTYWDVVYHRDTKVMYVVSDGSYNRGTFVLLVNADGTPMLWED